MNVHDQLYEGELGCTEGGFWGKERRIICSHQYKPVSLLRLLAHNAKV